MDISFYSCTLRLTSWYTVVIGQRLKQIIYLSAEKSSEVKLFQIMCNCETNTSDCQVLFHTICWLIFYQLLSS